MWLTSWAVGVGVHGKSLADEYINLYMDLLIDKNKK